MFKTSRFAFKHPVAAKQNTTKVQNGVKYHLSISNKYLVIFYSSLNLTDTIFESCPYRVPSKSQNPTILGQRGLTSTQWSHPSSLRKFRFENSWNHGVNISLIFSDLYCSCKVSWPWFMTHVFAFVSEQCHTQHFWGIGLRHMCTNGQLILKANCQVANSSKRRTNYYYATCFHLFLEEIEDTKKTFRNYLTFRGSN